MRARHPSATPPASGGDADDIVVVPLRRPGRWIAAAIVVVLLALLAHSMATNPRFAWPVVGDYFTSRAVLIGLARTVELTIVAMLVGITLGVVIAVMRQSGNPLLSLAAAVYIGIFRGTPLLVQLLFWFNFAALYPTLSLGIPFGPTLVTGSVNDLITPFAAAILGLGLNEGAYMAEIVRAGILSVNEGEIEAAYALGLRRSTTMRRIVLPQALRVIIPPTGNEVITTLKNTSLVSVISLPELLYSTQLIYSKNFQVIPLLIVASLWYLIVTTALTVGQHYLERRRDGGGAGRVPGLWHRLVRALAFGHAPRAAAQG
ncbi:MAG TPA: amino acid ABC transporter permease [Alphaproteobacteria bacterium]|nr:amino acid ABC transporter permease [Alphaproteobacteria bacterium]